MTQFIITNPQTCIGCHACEVACVLTYHQGKHPDIKEQFQPRIKVHKISQGRKKVYTALACRQCENAPCVKSCPSAALKQSNEKVHLNKSLCIGCKACVMACPFGAIRMVDESIEGVLGVGNTEGVLNKIIAHKCDLCNERRASPACLDACPTGSIKLVSIDKIKEQRRQKQLQTAFGTTPDRAMINKQYSPFTSEETPFSRLVSIPRQDADKKPIEERKKTYNEIYYGFTQTQAQLQSSRCLSCGPNSICEWTCPLHNRIPHWIKLVKEGRIIEAAELSNSTNSLPEITGRVCPQDRLCEGSCTLKNENDAVTIGNIERYVTETAFELGWRPEASCAEPTGRKVAIIGAGPAGLACADVLVRRGIKPVVFDRHPEIGGMLTFGIPNFKLEKEIMIRRREIFSAMGIEFHLNTEIGKDVSMTELLNNYDAIFTGIGTYESLKARLENENAQGVYQALDFLTANTKHVMGLPELASQPYINTKDKRIVVLGGGDTAMDCLRTAIRQGASSVTCAYRRDESNMPGSKKEVKNAREEGAEFMFMMQPIKIEVNEANQVIGIRMVKTELGDPDAKGRRSPQPIADSEFVLEADIVIVAFGFIPHDISWLQAEGVQLNRRGTIAAIPIHSQKLACQTDNPKIFAGGDIVRGADLVVTAISDGRMAARSIMQYLNITNNQMNNINKQEITNMEKAS
ncbi:oxidoreductase FeS-binding subunit [Gilliamella sp. wkB108]|uniref:formate-dependent uric acid utilization protein AegA n=1 Tax=Gilliamella sp. wkB108 TaxID=3120256 RepID=UPI00080E182F|nr:formate-dependent uric acid utilization protein AegA [Gilliamella apicola]OCG27292.1 oxidoreductase FeS-binding subunit [Gilliamella apicola]